MIFALLALLAILQAADVATTAYALSRGFDEANPIVRKLFGRLNGKALVAVSGALKIVGSVPIVLFSLAYPGWWPVAAIYDGSLAFVAFHNLRAILRDRASNAS